MTEYVCPLVLNRRALLTADTLELFSNPEVRRYCVELGVSFEQVRTSASRAVELLRSEVADADVPTRRLHLETLRRVAELKPVNKRDLFSGEVRQAIDEYAEHLSGQSTLMAKATAAWEEGYAAERSRLHDFLSDRGHPFMFAPKFIGDSIPVMLDSYLKRPSREHNKVLRKRDVTLAKLVTRAAAKTSPFSSLSASYFSKSPDDGRESAGPMEFRTISRINDTLLYRILDAVLERLGPIETDVFRLERFLISNDERIFWTSLVDQESNLRTFRANDVLRSVKRSDILSSVASTFADRGFTQEEFVASDELAALVPTAEDRLQLLQKLVGLGMVLKEPLVSPQSADLLTEVSDVLAARRDHLGAEAVERILSPLAAVRELMTAYDRAGPEAQLLLHREVGEVLAGVCEYVGVAPAEAKEVIYQDYVCSEVVGHRWTGSEHTSALSDLMRFYNVFNTSWYFKRLMGAELHAIFGSEEVSVKENWRRITQALLNVTVANRAIWSDQLNVTDRDFGIDALDRLQEAKNHVLRYLASQIGEPEIVLSDDFIGETIRSVPEEVMSRDQSADFFVQVDAKTNEVIVNHFYEGNLMYLLRFVAEVPSVRDDPDFNAYLTEVLAPRRVADIPSTFGFNANNRHIYTQQTLSVYTAPRSPRTPNAVDLMDLTLKVDESTLLPNLWLDGEDIHPVFLGTLMPTRLPGLIAAISLMSRDFALYTDISQYVTDICVKAAAGDELVFVPRVRFGESIVLAREKHALQSTVVDGMTDFGIISYFVAHDLPLTFFCHAYSPVDLDLGDAFSLKKPQYVDLTSHLLLRLFRQTAQRSPYVVIEVCSPELDTDGFAEEHIVEITRLAG